MSPRLSIIPAGAIFDRTLEPRDLQVIGLLGCHTDKAGWCRRSQVKMARELDCSRGSIQNALERLCAAGWVEKKRLDVEVEEAGKHPSRSYAYRVLLDRDDYAFESAPRAAEDDELSSHAETASQGAGCQSVGTPSVPTDQHPGANTYDGTGANTYDGTKNDPLERPPIERERDARARDAKDRKARFLAAFEQRWPTAAADDRQRTGYAAEALTEEEEQSALAGIGPFLDNLKRLGRKNTPAGWRYLEEKRWTLLEQKAAQGPQQTQFAGSSREGRAIAMLFEIAGKSEFFHRAVKREGVVYWSRGIDAQLLALADVRPRPEWQHVTTRQRAGAWSAFINLRMGERSQVWLAEGVPIPEPFPPRVDGTWSQVEPTETSIPTINDDDLSALAAEGQSR